MFTLDDAGGENDSGAELLLYPQIQQSDFDTYHYPLPTMNTFVFSQNAFNCPVFPDKYGLNIISGASSLSCPTVII